MPLRTTSASRTPALPLDQGLWARVREETLLVGLGRNRLHAFDRQGRLLESYVEGRSYRRGLDGRVLEKEHLGEAEFEPSDLGISRRRRRQLTPEEAVAFTLGAHRLASRALQGLAGGTTRLLGVEPSATWSRRRRRSRPASPLRTEAEARRWLAAAAAWDEERLQADVEAFRQVWRPIGILPPDQYLSIVAQATEGCWFNRCTFCTFYQEMPFRVRRREAFREHLQQIRSFFGPAITRRHALFLGDANALALPMRMLVPFFEELHAAFPIESEAKPGGGEARGPDLEAGRAAGPAAERASERNAVAAPATAPAARAAASGWRVRGVFGFLDAFEGRKKTVEEFAALRRLGLVRVYVGLESGSDALLRFLNKPGTAEDALETVRRMKAAGLQVGVILMVGAGGDRYAEAHQRESVALLNRMDLGMGDIVYFSEFVLPVGSEYERRAREEGVRELTGREMREQLEAMQGGLRLGDGAKVSLYDIREFLY